RAADERDERAPFHSITSSAAASSLSGTISIFNNALNFRCSAIAALVRSPWRCCPFRLPGGPPLTHAICSTEAHGIADPRLIHEARFRQPGETTGAEHPNRRRSPVRLPPDLPDTR